MTEYDYVSKKRDQVDAFPRRGMGLVRALIRWTTRLQVTVYRASKGRLMNKFVGGYPICIVTTTGAKSGAIRRIALIHLPSGDEKLMVASQGGMDKMPAWYYNVTANPAVKIMVGGAPVTQAFADEIGADAYGEDAMEAVEIGKEILGMKRKNAL